MVQQGDNSTFQQSGGDSIIQGDRSVIQKGTESGSEATTGDVSTARKAAPEPEPKVRQVAGAIAMLICACGGVAVGILTVANHVSETVGIPLTVVLIGGPFGLKTAVKYLRPDG